MSGIVYRRCWLEQIHHKPLWPLLIVWYPYNSRIIEDLHYIAIENPFLSVYVSFWWSSLHNTNVKGTNTFDTSHSLELDVDVSSWLKMKARHWWSLQVSPPYTMWGSFALYSSSLVHHVIIHKLQACNPLGWLSWTCPCQPWSPILDVILS